MLTLGEKHPLEAALVLFQGLFDIGGQIRTQKSAGCAPSNIQVLNILKPSEGCPAVCKSGNCDSGKVRAKGVERGG